MKRFSAAVVLVLLLVGVVSAEWSTHEAVDLMTDDVVVTVYAEADVSQNTIGTPLFAIRRTGEKLEVFISWGGYSMDRVPSAVRFGSGETALWSVSLSTDREATFFADGSGVIEGMRSLAPDDTLTVAAKRATGVLSVARWIVGDVIELIDRHVIISEG